MAEVADQVIAQLRKSRKYRDLCDETLARVAQWAAVRNASAKAATKAAKRKLHQVYGAYVGQVDVNQVLALVDQVDRNTPKPICEQILRTHVSTAERLDDLGVVFEAVWDVTGQPKRVMDLACGLNPFALPWMGHIEEYFACDIDIRLASCIGKFFENIGFSGVSSCHDLLVTVPSWQADVVFLFKTLPCLEQQEKGAGLAILKQIQAPHIVVSFPSQSLGGHNKGMTAHYDGIIRQLANDLKVQIHPLVFARESYYVLSA
ncbi:MAG: 16S rRNA methyltransferase [Candidatus Latescibacteria bacterium]|jgi:16S rRNA (guanine(1405)-N(7))-methyltransferase|nr:16S rRNA methyltransferase [Candidatus Latescibacterota bacterium]MBT4137495.1 16S rRNA methyltransferase [Candidatus Latescibacterota bacterium]MBT5831542.1 16S rRNA methyltransferase [Candidatus Latescibacterota bacterium]